MIEPFKVIVVGETNVGKTQLTHRYIYNIFKPNVGQTIGVDFFTKIISPEALKTKPYLSNLDTTLSVQFGTPLDKKDFNR